MPNSRPFDHRYSGRFIIEIEGVQQGAFAACDGLEARIDVIEFADGNDLTARKRPGRVRCSNLVLRRGVVGTEDLWNWFKATANGQVERRAGSIILLSDAAEAVLRYNFFEAWPCRWKGLVLEANGSSSLVEELELAIEKIERG